MVFTKKISYFYNCLTQFNYLHMYFSPYNREEEGVLDFRNIYFSEKYYNFHVMEELNGMQINGRNSRDSFLLHNDLK